MVKSTFTISDPYCPMIELGSIHSSQGCNRAGQGISWSFITRNFRHVDLHVEPIRIPIISEVGLAAGSDLNSRNPFSGILAPGVKDAACVLSFVEFPVINFYDIRHDNQFKESCKSIDTKVTAESLHDPSKLRNFQERCR
jgi:hypothetical protein